MWDAKKSCLKQSFLLTIVLLDLRRVQTMRVEPPACAPTLHLWETAFRTQSMRIDADSPPVDDAVFQLLHGIMITHEFEYTASLRVTYARRIAWSECFIKIPTRPTKIGRLCKILMASSSFKVPCIYALVEIRLSTRWTNSLSTVIDSL
jgi:hypothetical protein